MSCEMHSSVLMRPLVAVIGMAWVSALMADGGGFFESRIRPVLVERCYECHSVEGKKQKGGLVLDSKAGWEHGGDTGAAIAPGKVEESLLIKAVRWTDKDLKMPPEKSGGKLTEAQIADLETWVRGGAHDPRVGGAAVAVKRSWDEVFAERSQWWSLQPVRAAEGSVDGFLQARMKMEKLEPAPRADAQTLIRRATLVLTGVPPTAGEVDAFVAESNKDFNQAYATLVERLLASPRYGERFARHWLDVVRFTETHGNEWNYDMAYAWRYRDYVIRAFNEDLPYDQFVREQVAGDLLAQPRWNTKERFNESAVGTAFYRFGEVNHDSCVQFGVIGYDIADNQVDTLTKAFQATTVACARCHDHKLDAVSTKDYHALLGIVRGTRSVQHTLDGPEVNRDAMAELKALKKDLRSELAKAWRGSVDPLDAAKLEGLVAALKGKDPDISSPLHAWAVAAKAKDVAAAWTALAEEQAKEAMVRVESNQKNFTELADFRTGVPAGWKTDGMGLRDGGAAKSGDFTVAHEGGAAVKEVLPAGVYTFALSDKLNGALRSPTLKRGHGKVSFEVMGGRFSLARLVFNNCQLNYKYQQSLHHDDWTWLTIDFPENTDAMLPYAELLTYWDNPKFPDPLGTLGKDTVNQRGPYEEHAKNPRTWWGVRRIVMHDGAATPKDELSHMARLFTGEAPKSLEEVAARYAAIGREAVAAFGEDRATDDDVKWLNWLLRDGVLLNAVEATPRLAELMAKYREVELRKIGLPKMMPGMADEGSGLAQPVLSRGDHMKPGGAVEHRYVKALTPAGFAMSKQGSGRNEVAQLIASGDNPLTARVMVNRVWQWVFGRGLVGTPDDFGHLGELPSHPELLDYLAARFVNEGWSVKRLVRELVTSRAFQAVSAPSAEVRQRDPQNVWLTHYSARRVEAEVIRDSMLAVSGRLDETMYGPSVHPYRAKADPDKRLFVGPLDGDGRRSIYLKFQLMEAPHFLSAFNLPGGKVTQGRRDASNSPAQSLAMLNDPFVLAMADVWAGRLMADGKTSISDRVHGLFREALGRTISISESEACVEAVRNLAKAHGVAEAEVLTSRAVWKDAAHMMFNLKEFIFIP